MTDNITQGKRTIDYIFPTNPGEYAKGKDGSWLLCLPTGIRATINNLLWTTIEHDDGTITVSPSISVTCHVPKYSWHGYLTKGIWKEC